MCLTHGVDCGESRAFDELGTTKVDSNLPESVMAMGGNLHSRSPLDSRREMETKMEGRENSEESILIV